nr:hypothetical protein [uncultured Dysosmobacter sp.]
MLSDLQLSHASFTMWLMGEGEDNRADLEKAKRYLPIVLDECVTATQKTYIMHYFVDRMNTTQIAKLYGVHTSTVSRTIRRGLDKAYGYLRFVSPLFMNAPQKRSYLRGGSHAD